LQPLSKIFFVDIFKTFQSTHLLSNFRYSLFKKPNKSSSSFYKSGTCFLQDQTTGFTLDYTWDMLHRASSNVTCFQNSIKLSSSSARALRRPSVLLFHGLYYGCDIGGQKSDNNETTV
jgi:hypothetical protein